MTNRIKGILDQTIQSGLECDGTSFKPVKTESMDYCPDVLLMTDEALDSLMEMGIFQLTEAPCPCGCGSIIFLLNGIQVIIVENEFQARWRAKNMKDQKPDVKIVFVTHKLKKGMANG